MSPQNLVLQVRHHKFDPLRYRLYQRVIWIALVGNLMLAVSKGAVALTSGSNAVMADAANSLSDMLYTVFMAIGLSLSQKPADRTHPQGHSRFEPLVSVIIAMTMGLTGYEVIRHSIDALFAGATSIDPGWPTIVLIGGGLVKAIMYLLVRQIARVLHGPAIEAAAADNLSDVLTSVAALAGVLGSNWISPLLDPLAGVVVSLWVFRTAYGVVRENVGYLTGRAADPDIIEDIIREARSVAGVDDVHQVVADYVGPQLRVDMHIDVDGCLPLTAIHDISEAVTAKVENLEQVDLVFIHVEPAEDDRTCHS